MCILIKPSVDDVQVMNLIGDVKGKVAIMVDDMIDTAGIHLRMFRYLLT